MYKKKKHILNFNFQEFPSFHGRRISVKDNRTIIEKERERRKSGAKTRRKENGCWHHTRGADAAQRVNAWDGNRKSIFVSRTDLESFIVCTSLNGYSQRIVDVARCFECMHKLRFVRHSLSLSLSLYYAHPTIYKHQPIKEKMVK